MNHKIETIINDLVDASIETDRAESSKRLKKWRKTLSRELYKNEIKKIALIVLSVCLLYWTPN